MGLSSLLLIAVGLSMDAFAVSVCKGLSQPRLHPRHMLACGLYFGGFQGLMPLIGWLLGVRFQGAIAQFDHWIACGLLTLIGLQMIRDRNQEEDTDASFSPRSMIPLAVATSVDALAVGITFAFLQVEILSAVLLIATTTFILSALGVWLGACFGGALRQRAQLLGGILLIAMGFQILLEHLFYL